ncbi:hypothetical protein [Edaphobacter albus]|uniref:hypothetical protein n=1 Tax=Edaphobacter sp. 4G125 TaxID=2763071 RepID=UPI0016459065|nr:hypothetical protein [Edaphobacter sp. 4G125]QNI35998.1 hypothetical protein H7846_13450 [Edaphobacter sp. 4G125]
MWFSISLTMILVWIQAVRRGHTKSNWNTFIALILLLVLLFPVISITDDLGAMGNPSAEFEHLVRRSEMPPLPLTQDISALLEIGILAILLCFCLAVLFIWMSRFSIQASLRRLADGFARSVGVRPPPMVSLSA